MNALARIDQENPWTEGRVAELRRLYALDLSFSAIARELGGGVTRNAAIGKARRIFLTRPRPQPKPRRIANPTGYRGFVKVPPKFKPAPIKLAPQPPDVRSITLLELGPHDCRWPLNDGGPWLFCGCPRTDGSSYCAFHARASVGGVAA